MLINLNGISVYSEYSSMSEKWLQQIFDIKKPHTELCEAQNQEGERLGL
jgi:hypothetical protein